MERASKPSSPYGRGGCRHSRKSRDIPLPSREGQGEGEDKQTIGKLPNKVCKKTQKKFNSGRILVVEKAQGQTAGGYQIQKAAADR